MSTKSNFPSLGRSSTTLAASILALVVSSHAVAGDCVPTWSTALGTPGMSGGYVASFLVHDDGAGPTLFATGNFTSAGGSSNTARIARWNGTNWVAVGTGLVSQFSNTMFSFQGDLYVGGYFDSASGVPGTAKLARWDGAQWNSIGAQLDSFLSSVWSFEIFDDGDGEALYIGGNYLNIGGLGIDHIARWDGKAFSGLGGTIVGPNQIVLALKSYDGHLYACGRFQSVAGVSAFNIARYDGSQWTAVAGGITGTQVLCMEVHDGDLYVGGTFTAAGGVPAMRVARWDGTQWHALGAGLNLTVQRLVSYDDGSGKKIYAVGNFTASGDGAVVLPHVARWNGSSWENVGAADANVFAASTWHDGTQEVMLIGGNLTTINGTPTGRVASYVGCATDGPAADLNGDGIVDGADLGILLAAWGICDRCPADLNGDGVVDGADLGILLAAWGSGRE